jgi:hypothetical protein
MDDFLLCQMDSFFTDGVCFDTSKEGGAPTPRSPILCQGQSEGPRQRGVIARPMDIVKAGAQ